jgi:hypothetical protein
VDEKMVAFTQHGASASFAEDVVFMVNKVMANKENFGRRKPFDQSCDGPKLYGPKRSPPRDDAKIRSLSLNSPIDFPPCNWINGVKNVLCPILSQRLFANVSVRSSRKKTLWILSLKSEEADLMPLHEMMIEQRGVMGDAPTQGMGGANETNAHNQGSAIVKCRLKMAKQHRAQQIEELWR